jgi:putative transposase
MLRRGVFVTGQGRSALSSGNIRYCPRAACDSVIDVGLLKRQEVSLRALIVVAFSLLGDLVRIGSRTRAEIIAEKLFLRRQLALYRERKSRRRRPTPAAKLALVVLSRFFPWTQALAIVRPGTFVHWHRAGFRLLWRWKSRPLGRPPLPKNLRALIITMAEENPSWGEGRIADELSLQLGILVDSRTVGKYIKQSGRPQKPVGQRWSTFIQDHASAIVACDFFTSVLQHSRSCTCSSR